MTSYNKLPFASLKHLLIARGLNATGTKAQMIARLKQQDVKEEAAEKAMTDAIQAASVAQPQAGQDKDGGKGKERAEKTRKNKKREMDPVQDIKRKEMHERSAAMRRERLARKKGRVMTVTDVDDEVKRLMAGIEEFGEALEGVGGIVVNATQKKHDKGLARRMHAQANGVANEKQERSESEGTSARHEKGTAGKSVVLKLLLAVIFLVVAGIAVLQLCTADEMLSFVASLWEKVGMSDSNGMD